MTAEITKDRNIAIVAALLVVLGATEKNLKDVPGQKQNNKGIC